MAKLRLSASARQDLRTIRKEGVEKHGGAASQRYMFGFDRLFDLLQRHPLAGQERPEFTQSVRALSHRPYRLLYRVENEMVVVDRMIHMSRDVRRALRGE